MFQSKRRKLPKYLRKRKRETGWFSWKTIGSGIALAVVGLSLGYIAIPYGYNLVFVPAEARQVSYRNEERRVNPWDEVRQIHSEILDLTRDSCRFRRATGQEITRVKLRSQTYINLRDTTFELLAYEYEQQVEELRAQGRSRPIGLPEYIPQLEELQQEICWTTFFSS